VTYIDLTPARLRRVRFARHRKRQWTVCLTVYGTAVMLGWLWTHGHASGVNAAQARTQEQLLQRQDAERVLASAQKDVIAATRAVEAARIVRSFPEWSPVLREIAVRRGPDIVLDRCDIKPVSIAEAAGLPLFAKFIKAPAAKPTATTQNATATIGYRVIIGGVAPTPSAVAEFVLQLQQWQAFDVVSQVEVRARTVRAAEAVAFTVECVLAEGRLNP
jgi:hypothetical protein